MERRNALKLLTLGAAGSLAMTLTDLRKFADDLPADEKQPALFLGHGSPMNAIEDNLFTRSLGVLGTSLQKPKAVLVVSAHWLTKGTFVSTALHPETIYDFGGFPPELSQVKYPAPGAPDQARLVKSTILTTHIEEDPSMGLDHGAWSVIRHMWPDASVPVFQMSIDWYKSPQWHYNLAQELKALRRKGIMIITSGNITHNLRNVVWNNIDAPPVDWALEFDEAVKKNIDSRDHLKIINYDSLA
ncbi:MAG TPA: class III extradiol ring-cleavage dioxygenase, partial [Bacteroidia bacterium]|nr:class III extradiol ring-cleavage dioxygenase [Bacteroidia bacterium]